MASSLDVGRDMPLWKIGSQRLAFSTARSNSGQSKSAALGTILQGGRLGAGTTHGTAGGVSHA
jgi:hypothetical protein